MKIKLLTAVLGMALLAAGCVDTVSGTHTAGVPFVKDQIQTRYDRSAAEILQAAKDVLAANGILINELTRHGQTNAVNQIAQSIQGEVNQSTVWVRVQQVEPRISEVTVQVRTRSGGADLDLAAQIDKQIVLKLAR